MSNKSLTRLAALHKTSAMPTPVQAKLPYLSTRCSAAFKQRVTDHLTAAGVEESEMLRVAVAEFLERHATPLKIIEAICTARVSGIAKK